jgi:hypothetical protein
MGGTDDRASSRVVGGSLLPFRLYRYESDGQWLGLDQSHLIPQLAVWKRSKYEGIGMRRMSMRMAFQLMYNRPGGGESHSWDGDRLAVGGGGMSWEDSRSISETGKVMGLGSMSFASFHGGSKSWVGPEGNTV